jgi:hypothetical protein
LAGDADGADARASSQKNARRGVLRALRRAVSRLFFALCNAHLCVCVARVIGGGADARASSQNAAARAVACCARCDARIVPLLLFCALQCRRFLPRAHTKTLKNRQHTHKKTSLPSSPIRRKLDTDPVDEDLRSTIRAFCTGLASALNRYYAFGSVFAEEV